mmetsp:Transcript_68826/g.159552  ORF Transcript_68826/g.159552 Transcript_68826/m.159552 type:complete len:230 (-) Transcript_68826:2-691(-)
MMVSPKLGKKYCSSVTHSTPMKPAPTTRIVAFSLLSLLMWWNSSSTWRRLPSINRSSMWGQSLAARPTSCTVGNHRDSPLGLKGPKLQPEQMMQKSKDTSSVPSTNMGLILAVLASPSSVSTSPQRNFTPILRSSTGWRVKVRASRWQGLTKARSTPGVYSKYSLASTTVTSNFFLSSRAQKVPENWPPMMRHVGLALAGMARCFQRSRTNASKRRPSAGLKLLSRKTA